MNREEILQKSRTEHHNQDVYEKEVLKEGGTASAITAAILATLFFVIQILTGGGINYGLYAVVFSIFATSFIIKAIRLKRRHEIIFAALYALFVLMLSAAHLYTLFSASAIQ